MSTPARRKDFFGVNIKTGTTPGGFLNSMGKKRGGRVASMEEIKGAASDALHKRGIGLGPTAFEANQHLPPKP